MSNEFLDRSLSAAKTARNFWRTINELETIVHDSNATWRCPPDLPEDAPTSLAAAIMRRAQKALDEACQEAESELRESAQSHALKLRNELDELLAWVNPDLQKAPAEPEAASDDLDTLLYALRSSQWFGTGRKLVPEPAIVKAAEAISNLRAFKAYVHRRLTEAGVPENPEPEKTSGSGCRIGPRLDWLIRKTQQ